MSTNYFTLPELCVTNQNVDNVPGWAEVENLRLLVQALNMVREIAKRPVHINSGFRCPAVNKACGGAVNSAHLQGSAADFTVGSIEDNKELFEKIIKAGLLWDQLILERGGLWIHLALVQTGNRKEILRLG